MFFQLSLSLQQYLPPLVISNSSISNLIKFHRRESNRPTIYLYIIHCTQYFFSYSIWFMTKQCKWLTTAFKPRFTPWLYRSHTITQQWRRQIHHHGLEGNCIICGECLALFPSLSVFFCPLHVLLLFSETHFNPYPAFTPKQTSPLTWLMWLV